MFHPTTYPGTLEENYKTVLLQLKGLTYKESDLIANLSNAAALLNLFLEDVNWVGFYLAKKEELVLGPFQGLPACIRIPFNKGVCGYAATTKKTILVKNVHEFPGHIACDGATNSEIVIPILKKGELIGVLDIDSPSLNRFTEIDQKYLEEFVQILVETIPSV